MSFIANAFSKLSNWLKRYAHNVIPLCSPPSSKQEHKANITKKKLHNNPFITHTTHTHSLFWKQEMELTLVGLQAAGKTTLLNVISDGKAKDTIPTVGLNIRKITKGMLGNISRGVAFFCTVTLIIYTCYRKHFHKTLGHWWPAAFPWHVGALLPWGERHRLRC